jgi:D-glycero-alpha-D-manno-heptose-7-phosphate kinase
LFFTGIKRKAEELASRQVRSVARNRPLLKEMRGLVDHGYEILAGGGNLADFGALLHRSWELKRDLDQAISNDTIDGMYRAGLEAGAVGGKLLGAGGGGFLLLFVPPERRAAVELRLADFQRVDFRVNEPGSQIVHCSTDPRMGRKRTREAV